MTETELSTAIAAALFAAVLAGWVLHWLWCLLARAAHSERGRVRLLVEQLHVAEAAREAAEADRAELEARLVARIAELEQALSEQAVAHEAAEAGLAAERDRLVEEARREAEAAWEGLGNARRRIHQLEREIEELGRG